MLAACNLPCTLQPQLTREELLRGCELAARFGVATVCVRPSDVTAAVTALLGTVSRVPAVVTSARVARSRPPRIPRIPPAQGVGVSTVIGFPHGTTTTATKVAEALEAVRKGATELDMVVNIGWLRSGLVAEVRRGAS